MQIQVVPKDSPSLQIVSIDFVAEILLDSLQNRNFGLWNIANNIEEKKLIVRAVGVIDNLAKLGLDLDDLKALRQEARSVENSHAARCISFMVFVLLERKENMPRFMVEAIFDECVTAVANYNRDKLCEMAQARLEDKMYQHKYFAL